ncbi:MAG TPA: 3-oxoacyl-[acyl-carrier-protein] synthase III C-terminal domain-containing protein [Actinocrinis sp.]|jgi:3-oxoacyl-[acyl-carrier-protein] synthase-3|uniref:3-oxoacyl-[acyl-carrier-protein] synthase III C-terminal domain-containing protein n=1 Tax=Actinocrinis sp. TaxID=1920516 RepID=UPI002DDCCA19|nr:3-oxoacyl-[acyl-carrier-protein] synthase III C-terminal domain-containing protein [Actinocrinis sp.]HEV3170973.1 3-oxoacyl-[acyl-carrier-protein] synthase III C-terminal domain-containing protein [Actinocrinis sp.]
MTTTLYLERVGTFLPEDSLSVRELSGPLGLTEGQIALFSRFLGLDRIAVAPGLDLADMLTAAGEDALGDTDRDSVRYLLHAHTMQHTGPPSRHLLEGVRLKLGLRNASVVSLSHLNCVMGLYAFQVARYLLHGAPPQHKALIVTGDKILSHRLRLIPDTTLLGEAAAGCVVGTDPRGDGVVGRALTVHGRFYQCLDCPDPLRAEYKTLYVEELKRAMAAAIEDAGCDPASIAAVLPHNVNRLSWKKICGAIGIPADRVFLDNVPKLGHCYTSDPFINLAAARGGGRVAAGDLVLMASAGMGAAFAAAVVQLGEGVR